MIKIAIKTLRTFKSFFHLLIPLGIKIKKLFNADIF
jgi:hypothetical protein